MLIIPDNFNDKTIAWHGGDMPGNLQGGNHHFHLSEHKVL